MVDVALIKQRYDMIKRTRQGMSNWLFNQVIKSANIQQ